jgi:HlyD family secretion protein
MKMKRRNKWLLLGGAALAVILLVAAAWRFLIAAPGPGGSQAQTGETVTVTRGHLSASATAGGRVVARREAALALATSGPVQTVYVEIGDTVQAGDPLVQLQSGALRRAVTTAEQNVAIQQANLQQLRAGPGEADLAAAEAAVTGARAQLNDLLGGPTEEEVNAAEANLRAAQANVARASRRLGETRTPAGQGAILQAQAALEDAEEALLQAERNHQRLLDCEQGPHGEWTCVPGDLPFVSEEDEADLIRQAELQVVQARQNRDAAQAELERLQQGGDEHVVGASQANLAQMVARRDAAQADLDLLLAGPTEAEIASARSSLAEARANLAALQAGPGEAELARAEAQLAQAQIALTRAQNNLQKATLRAPFAGVVTAVYVSGGELAGGVAVDLLDPGSLEVVLDVDEVDVGHVAVGQPARVTLQAWPDREVETEIVSMAPAANSLALDGSVASFRVRLGLPQYIGGLKGVVQNPIFSTGVGLVLYGARSRQGKGFVPRVATGGVKALWGRMRGWFEGNF